MIPNYFAQLAQQYVPLAAGEDDRDGTAHDNAPVPVVAHISPEASTPARNYEFDAGVEPPCPRCGIVGHDVEPIISGFNVAVSNGCPYPLCERCGLVNFDDDISDLCAECIEDESSRPPAAEQAPSAGVCAPDGFPPCPSGHLAHDDGPALHR